MVPARAEYAGSVIAQARDEELLARVLGRSIKPEMPLGELLALGTGALVDMGFTAIEADKIVAVSEIARRHQPAEDGVRVVDPRMAVAQLASLRAPQSPVMVALLLDRDGRAHPPLQIAAAHHGCARASPQLAVRLAAEAGVAGLIVAHNHLTDDGLPTTDDLDYTRELRDVCHDAGVELTDHLIITRRSWTSLRRLRLIS